MCVCVRVRVRVRVCVYILDISMNLCVCPYIYHNICISMCLNVYTLKNIYYVQSALASNSDR